MINGISIVSAWVLDQDSAKDFYTSTLGMEVTNDIKLDNGMRWLAVRPTASAAQEFLLMDPSRSTLDDVWPVTGVLAGRSPPRPNHLGVSRREPLAVSGLGLTVRGLDALDGSPVLDVKAYVSELAPRGQVREPAWTRDLMRNYY